jgi:S1-C subfamily serine protease
MAAVMRGALAVVLVMAGAVRAEDKIPACSGLRGYVYRIRLTAPQSGGPGAAGYGSGFFLSNDGLFVTALHVFEEGPPARGAVVEVQNGRRWVDCPVTAVTAFSRKLDFAIVQVRAGSARVKVPPLAYSAEAGARVFGFRVGAPAAKQYRSEQSITCTEGEVSAVSEDEIGIKGEVFFAPGSSGSPVFSADGRAISIAVEMVNWNPEGRKPEWTFASVPLLRVLHEPKLASPLPLAEFLSTLRPAINTAP